VAALQLQPPSVAAITDPVASSTATTWAPKIPVTNDPVAGVGYFASAKGLAGKICPMIVPMFTESAGSG
jgi:hypothetical protein